MRWVFKMFKAAVVTSAISLVWIGAAPAQMGVTPCVSNCNLPAQMEHVGYGARVEIVPTQLFSEDMSDGTIDTTSTNSWAAPVASGGGVLATASVGAINLSSGTTSGGYSYIQSKQAYPNNAPGFLLYRASINFQGNGASPTEPTTNCKFFGLVAVIPATPTCANPVTEGFVFEVTAATTQGSPGGGKLQAAVYAGGTRQQIADLSVPIPGANYPAIPNPTPGGSQPLCPARAAPQPIAASNCPSIIDIWMRGDYVEWWVDYQRVAVMPIGSLGANNNTAFWTAGTVSTGNATASTIQINQAVIADEARRGPLSGIPANEVCVTPTVTAGSAYTTGNVVGGLIALPNMVRPNPGSGVLQAVRLTSKSNQSASEFDVTFFSSQPTASTWTDKAAPAIAAGDVPLVQPPVKLPTTNAFIGLGTHTVYGVGGILRPIKLAQKTLYAVITVVGTPTFPTTSDLQLCASVQQD